MDYMDYMKKNDIDKLRKEYRLQTLRRKNLADDPLSQFHHWFEEVIQCDILEPNAFALSTADSSGCPSCRTVLMKDFTEEGLYFFTNYESRKSRELGGNSRASALFLWKELERQVLIEGIVEKTSREVSEKYFAMRPRKSRIGAWASIQDVVLSSRQVLEQEFARYEKLYPGDDIPLPPNWGGFCIKPYAFEFWQGRESRLHDRFRYVLENGLWKIERLSP